MEVRKVQVIGGTTFIVSLPKKWVNQVGLKPSEELILVPKGNSSLLIKLKRDAEKILNSAISIEVNSRKKDEILRLIIAAYLAGYQNIKLVSSLQIDPSIESFIRNNSWKFMGLEISEEHDKEMILTTLFNSSALTIQKGLSKMLRAVSSMHRNAIEAFVENDVKMAEETVKLDDEVDRLNLFIIRQLMLTQGSLAASNIGISMLEESLIYRTIVKDLERIGDYAVEIAKKTSKDLKIPSSLRRELIELSQAATRTYQDALNIFLANDVENVDKVFRDEEEFLRKMKSILDNYVADKSLDPVSLIKLIQVIDILHMAMNKGRSIINETYNRYITYLSATLKHQRDL
ncbi:phosphate uptake regulator PhoU [Candidatus Bathyarchaeota archaeon]|nr:phosphate uptake regulator PhoU [Candidatus Bathyarchaeota archaeon]